MANTHFSHEEIKQDVLTNPRYAAFFAPYHPQVQARFAQQYAYQKWDWQHAGAAAEADAPYIAGRFDEAAYNRLWDIQRKKLFDLQCRWRAGHLTVAGIDCIPDFGRYDAEIENCPVLPAITPEELNLYCNFVQTTFDFDEVLDRDGGDGILPRNWQDYEAMRLAENEFDRQVPDHERQGIHAPAWYDFHNLHTGHGPLLGLPDVRGPRETPYREAYWANRRARHLAKPAPAPPTDPRPPYLSLVEDEAMRTAFVQQFETPKLRRQKAAYQAQQARAAADAQAEEDFAYLKALDADQTVPLDAAPDWRTALRRAVGESQRHQLLVHLPQVYEEYQLRESLGIVHPEAQEPFHRSAELYAGMREDLLDGRELLGEPRNFDFYN